MRIAEDMFRAMKADFIARSKSTKWSARALEVAVWNLSFMPYAPVREQLRNLVRWTNEARKCAGFKDRLDPSRCIRRMIPPISAFAASAAGLVEQLEEAPRSSM